MTARSRPKCTRFTDSRVSKKTLRSLLDHVTRMGQQASQNGGLMQADIVDGMGAQAALEAVKKLAGHEALVCRRCI
ncbi:protein of unknown function [Burkholderia multivorans]